MKRHLLVYILLSFSLCSFAQQSSSLKSTLTAMNNMRERLPIEKLYLQTDKPYYTLGDTLRFKAYVLNGDFLTSSLRSGLLYVELDNNYGQLIKRILIPMDIGLSWGDIALDETIPEGSYTLRVYTNWQRNFGESYIFKKNITISANTGGSTLIRSAFKLTDTTAKSSRIDATLQFTTTSHDPWRLKDLQLRVMNGRHSLYHTRAGTGIDGKVQLSFELADKTALKDLSITAQQTGKGADTTRLTIPVTINRAERTDVQFLPEGGSLITGISARIGFKAIGEDGKAAAVSGKVYNSKQQEVANFKATHKGMGSFELTPAINETYTAKILLPDGTAKTYPLPTVSQQGTALRVTANKDSLNLTLSATSGLSSRPEVYYLTGQARGVVCYAQTVNFSNTKPVKITLAKSLFPTGITRFTLLNEAGIPLNERIVYIDHNDNLQVSITPNKTSYTTRDSVALSIAVKDKEGKPVQGSFSLAVTDDSQVRTDSLGTNILNNLLFSSDLKGTVEEPQWYFENKDQQKEEALDNLLLTQGWTGYDWKDINAKTAPQPPQYIAEPEYTITGKVTNVFSKPVEKASVVLLSQKPSLIRDTITDKNGIFTFKGLFPVDTAVYKLSSHNKKGRDNVGIEMLNEFKPPQFAPQPQQTPWYVNSDTVQLNNAITKQAQLKAEANFRGEGKQLNEVVIKEKKIVKDSKHLIEPGIYDQVLDEQDMLAAGKMTLGELLEKKVKGFQAAAILEAYVPLSLMEAMKNPQRYPARKEEQIIGPAGSIVFVNGAYHEEAVPSSYFCDGKLIFFVIDGQPITLGFQGSPLGPMSELTPRDGDMTRSLFIKQYLDFFTAEDIKGIEVMTSGSRASIYATRYINSTVAVSPPFTFIEITTRSGHGPHVKRTSGSYLYKPLPFTLPKQFYSPKYTVQNKNAGIGTDLRSTIYWEPNVVTDANGKASVSFYSADKPGNYTLTLEGIDLDGNLGYYRQKIKVVAAIADKN